MKQFRFPLFLRLIFIGFLFVSILACIGWGLFWPQHKQVLVTVQLKSTADVLTLLVSGGKVPLLADDTLRMHGLVRGAKGIEGVEYAVILDNEKVVQAQSGPDGFVWTEKLLSDKKRLDLDKNIEVTQYTTNQGKKVYDLSREVSYNKKPLGAIHLGVSEAFIENILQRGRLSLLRSAMLPGLCVVSALCFLIFLYSRRISKRTRSLIRAVEECGDGKLQEAMEHYENSEIGDVQRAIYLLSQRLAAREKDEPPKLEQYLNISSLDQILETPVSKGEPYAFRRPVAVFFASIKGFGACAGTEQPEEIIKALNKYISTVTRSIISHGGYVDKVVGDAVIGIFGVSLYRDNHTIRAIKAALDLQDTLSSGSAGESQLLSNVCVGISSGIVLSGNIGSDAKVEYSSIGKSIKEAYWLSHLGHPGEVLLGEEMYSSTKDSVNAEKLPPQKVMEGVELIRSYRLLSMMEEKDGQT